MALKRGFSDPVFAAGGKSEYDTALEAAALGIINAARVHHGLEPIKWDFPALSSEHRRHAMLQAAGALAALEGAGFTFTHS